jgi:cellobiose-specific phosphotransferase system component IIC
MTPVLLPPMLLGFLSETSPSVCSALIISFTALVYLAMIWGPFLRDSGTKTTKQSEDAFHRGEEK